MPALLRDDNTLIPTCAVIGRAPCRTEVVPASPDRATSGPARRAPLPARVPLDRAAAHDDRRTHR